MTIVMITAVTYRTKFLGVLNAATPAVPLIKLTQTRDRQRPFLLAHETGPQSYQHINLLWQLDSFFAGTIACGGDSAILSGLSEQLQMATRASRLGPWRLRFTAVRLCDLLCTITCEVFVACVINLCKKKGITASSCMKDLTQCTCFSMIIYLTA